VAKILIVDDKPAVRLHFGEWLASLGYTVIITGDSEMVPEMIRFENPDLVLVDLLFNCEYRLDLLPQIHRENARVPILIVTSRENARKDPRMSFAADLLIRGFYFDDLTRKVIELLEAKPTVPYSASA
jgi:two-component system, OmpR family, phosphate regulon response regulator OmpR